MSINKQIAKITIQPNKLHSGKIDVSVHMPIWIKNIDGGKLIQLGLFGGMSTFVDTEDKIDEAVKQMLKSFFKMANQAGKGFQAELKSLGWETKKANMRFRVPVSSNSKYNTRQSASFTPKDSDMISTLIETANRSNKYSLQGL